MLSDAQAKTRRVDATAGRWGRLVCRVGLLAGLWCLPFGADAAPANVPVAVTASHMPTAVVSDIPADITSTTVLNTVDFARTSAYTPLVSVLQLYEDKTAALSAPEVVARLEEQRPSTGTGEASPKSLNRGYTRSAIWLVGAFRNSTSLPVTRWLAVGAPTLEDVRFFQFDGNELLGARQKGRLLPTQVRTSGNAFPLSIRDVRTARPTFAITLAPGEVITVAIRIKTRSAMNLAPELWSPGAFTAMDQHNTMLEMLLTGSLLTIALYALLQGVAYRDRVLLLLGGTAIAEVGYNMAFHGYLYHYVLQQGGEWVLRAPSIFSAVAVALVSAMALTFSGIGRIRSWRVIYWALIAAMIGGGFASAFGDYLVAARMTLDAVFIANVVWLVSMVDGVRRRMRQAAICLIAFSLTWLTLFERLAFLRGILSKQSIGGPEIVWDNLALGAMIVMIIGSQTRQLRREQNHAREALLAERAEKQVHLEKAVQERTLALQNALIDAAEANRAQTDFLARVSHDLRTPLTSIIGFADLIQVAGHADPVRSGIIRRSASHMLAMVNDLIDVAAGAVNGKLVPEPTYTYALFDVIAAISASTMRGKNQFSLIVAANVPGVLYIDSQRLTQMLSNLIENANKFTDNGSITLRVLWEWKAPDVTSSVAKQYEGDHSARGMLTFEVRDTGCGIEEGDQQSIFEPFRRLDPASLRSGMGLGLAIVAQWANRMGGSVHLTSAPGVGTTVSFTIETCEMSESSIRRYHLDDALAVLPAIDGTGFVIWLAEDTAEIRRFLQEELVSQGFDAVCFANGNTLIAALLEARRLPDLILTDRTMEEGDGNAVLIAARVHAPGTAVVSLSAISPSALQDTQVLGYTYDSSLLKPINLALLRNTLVDLLGVERANR